VTSNQQGSETQAVSLEFSILLLHSCLHVVALIFKYLRYEKQCETSTNYDPMCMFDKHAGTRMNTTIKM